MYKKIFYVKDLHEYINVIKELNSTPLSHKLWYRGQNNSRFMLTPGIMRMAYSIRDNLGYKIKPTPTDLHGSDKSFVTMTDEHKLLDMFKEFSKHDLNDIVQPQNDIQWMELGQHYGLPTFLLDWSTDPLIALFFAISTIDISKSYPIPKSKDIVDDIIENCASVWVINPLEINKLTLPESKILNSTDNYDEIMNEMTSNDYGPKIGTFCFEGVKSNPRIIRQSGNFTYTLHDITYTLDYMSTYQKEIVKINIPYSSIKTLMKDLKSLDLTEETIYFGKNKRDQIAKKIKNKVYQEFYRSLNGFSQKSD